MTLVISYWKFVAVSNCIWLYHPSLSITAVVVNRAVKYNTHRCGKSEGLIMSPGFIYLLTEPPGVVLCKSRKENPQKLTQLSSRSHPRHLMGKRTA